MPRRYDLVIVGMGSAGMTAAEFASTLPIKVAAVERGRLGGDCLWTGCVPSKALLASAKVAHHMRTAAAFGIEPVEPRIDTAKVFARIREVQQRVAATDDSPQRFRDELGIDLIEGTARLTSPTSLDVGGERIETRFVLLCTGSRPVVPPIPGLEEAGHLDSETVWDIQRAPQSLIALGGGPIAIEMSQGFRRLGVPVTVVERADRILPRDEPELAGRLLARLRDEGVDVRLRTEAERVTVEDGLKAVHTSGGERLIAHELVVGVGRQPNVEGLGLEDVGVETGKKGVVVDDALRSSVDTVYAAGDVAGRYLFTHAAGFEAVRAVRNMFFPWRSKGDYGVPWCTFTDPELAHAGLTSDEARKRFGADDVEVHRHELSHSDRARADGTDDGVVLVVTHKDRVVGAHILAPSAGELVHELALAIDRGMKLVDIGSVIHVYPTLGTEIGKAGAQAAFRSAERFGFLVRSRA
jgi:pyruvate/2-oxoglutarate dehydrogenase complex dihydrolipoamide dehydrogenase (E3) component